MKILKFNKYGIYITFAVNDVGELLILSISDTEKEKDIEPKRFFTAFEMSVTGMNPNDHHGAKHTGGMSPHDLKYKKHIETKDSLIFELENEFFAVTLNYEFFEGTKTVRSSNEIKNKSNESFGIEYISSFCLYAFDINTVMIPHNGWCRELDWREYTPEQLGYSKVNSFSTKRIAVSNTGTWSTKEYLPMGIIKNDDGILMWQIEHNGSWNWEISDIAGAMYLKLSGPSERENGWWKELKPGESIKSVCAAVCFVSGDLDDVIGEMTQYRRRIAYRADKDKELPVIFNDYLDCLDADPTTEKEIPVIDAAANAGAEIYCMDAGWYANGTWWETVGEWKVFEERFPGGMKKVFDYIRKKGMLAGIWLEPEVMGIECPILDKFDDSCFFMRHGKRIIDHGRYQFDFRNKKVTDFLDGVVDGLINEYGISYFKFDYNIDGGIGTEVDSDSFGDGLMKCNSAYLDWIDGIYKRHPGIIIENCASGGMRMEYKSLSHTSLQSLTDANDVNVIATIAAMSQTAVIPEQSAVWCAPKKDFTLGEIACSVTSAMFKRIHLSGQTAQLDDEQTALIKEGVEFYKNTRHMIKEMKPFYPLGKLNFEDKIKCVGYCGKNKAYICVQNFNDGAEKISLPVKLDLESIKTAYPKNSKVKTLMDKNTLTLELSGRNAVINAY